MGRACTFGNGPAIMGLEILRPNHLLVWDVSLTHKFNLAGRSTKNGAKIGRSWCFPSQVRRSHRYKLCIEQACPPKYTKISTWQKPRSNSSRAIAKWKELVSANTNHSAGRSTSTNKNHSAGRSTSTKTAPLSNSGKSHYRFKLCVEQVWTETYQKTTGYKLSHDDYLYYY